MEIVIGCTIFVVVLLAMVFPGACDVVGLWAKIHKEDGRLPEEEAHHVLLKHEPGFYNLYYREACPKRKKELKGFLKSYIRQNRRSQDSSDRATVWAARKILKGRFNKEAYKELSKKLLLREMVKRHEDPGLNEGHRCRGPFPVKCREMDIIWERTLAEARAWNKKKANAPSEPTS
jgi:hypothetical protein